MESNRKDILNRGVFLSLFLMFWAVVIFQIAKITVLVVICAIAYSAINLYLTYELMMPKKRIICFLLMEMLLLVFWGIVALVQVII